MFAPALQSAFQSSQVLFIYIALDAIDHFKASSFMVLNMKKNVIVAFSYNYNLLYCTVIWWWSAFFQYLLVQCELAFTAKSNIV